MKYKRCPHCGGSTTCRCSTCGTPMTDDRTKSQYYVKGLCRACNGSGEVIDNSPEQQKQSSSCFIATAVYGEHHENVEFLRNFRDIYLEKSNTGRKFIELYYKYSPHISSRIRGKSLVKLFFKFSLETIIKIIKLFIRENK